MYSKAIRPNRSSSTTISSTTPRHASISSSIGLAQHHVTLMTCSGNGAGLSRDTASNSSRLMSTRSVTSGKRTPSSHASLSLSNYPHQTSQAPADAYRRALRRSTTSSPPSYASGALFWTSKESPTTRTRSKSTTHTDAPISSTRSGFIVRVSRSCRS